MVHMKNQDSLLNPDFKEKSRHLPIFTGRLQPTIFGASELNFCVRNGNRWDLTAIDTDYFRELSISSLIYFVHYFSQGHTLKTE